MASSVLTRKERVVRALSHQEPDHVPFEIGGTLATNIHPDTYAGVLDRLGWPPETEFTRHLTVLTDMITPSEPFLAYADSCVRKLGPQILRTNEEGPGYVQRYLDEWGVAWARVDESGEFADRGGPFRQHEPSLAELERYPWPDPSDPARYAGMKEEAERVRRETDCALVCEVPYGIVRECQRMRGFTEYLEDLLINPTFAEALMEQVVGIVTAIADRVLDEVPDADVYLWTEDMGFQDRAYMRAELYRKMVKPYHARLVEAIRKRTDATVAVHSDGAIRELLPDFIDIGIQVINPVQVSAKGMDSAELKREFGRDLCFWGAIDTQHVLPFGSPADVKAEVRRRINDLGPGGGYVVASSHNIQRDVSAENVIAMIEAVAEYGDYPLEIGA
jgi:uroporphyrinogen decarboxylase